MEVLKTDMGKSKKESFTSIVANKDPPLLQEACSEQVQQALRASAAVQTSATSDTRVCEGFFGCSEEKFLPTFLNGSTVSQSSLTRKKASAKTPCPKSVPTTMESLYLFPKVTHVNDYMGGGRLHAKTQWKMEYRLTAAVQIVPRTWSALLKSSGVGSFHTTY